MVSTHLQITCKLVYWFCLFKYRAEYKIQSCIRICPAWHISCLRI